MLKNRKGQSLSTFLMILFGLSIVFYAIGYKPIILETFDDEVGSDSPLAESFVNDLAGIFTDPTFLKLIGFATVAGFLATGSSFSAVFLVPIFFITVFANMLILPMSFIFDPALPTFVKLSFGIFMNLFLIISLTNFVKGGGA